MISTSGFKSLLGSSHKTAITGLQGLALAGGLGACMTEEPNLGETQSASTVNDFGGSSGCSTAVVIGLSAQIADEIGCINPGSIATFDASSSLIVTSNSVLQYLASDARDDLVAASQTATIQVNSAFRTVAAQYLLYHWYQNGRCGITAAATVGHSNHESFRAVDLANYSSVVSTMRNHGWAHDVSGDPVHFDHLASPDVRSRDTLAFQKLWNLNNPNDIISEDGSYGPQTEARLKKSPSTGFAIGATCTPSARIADASIVSVDGPDRVGPSQHAHYTLIVKNSSQTDWSAATTLNVASGAASQLYDAQSWVSATEIGPLNTIVVAGGQGVVDIDVMTPAVTEETPIFQQLELSDGGAIVGSIQIALTVTPDGGGASTDSTDTESDTVTGGCNSGGGGAGLLGISLAALVLVRRRRA
jgi:uncharacterized protein (TIGR03382 family)